MHASEEEHAEAMVALAAEESEAKKRLKGHLRRLSDTVKRTEQMAAESMREDAERAARERAQDDVVKRDIRHNQRVELLRHYTGRSQDDVPVRKTVPSPHSPEPSVPLPTPHRALYPDSLTPVPPGPVHYGEALSLLFPDSSDDEA
ncbi:hypothetical protein DIPPA_17052 [Diplonema papillatum]|nr:hypothetical protein DIPPA_17052 [Diplonema papillatum]